MAKLASTRVIVAGGRDFPLPFEAFIHARGVALDVDVSASSVVVVVVVPLAATTSTFAGQVVGGGGKSSNIIQKRLQVILGGECTSVNKLNVRKPLGFDPIPCTAEQLLSVNSSPGGLYVVERGGSRRG